MNGSDESALASLRGYLASLRRQWWIVGLVTIAALLAAALLLSRATPYYAAETKIVVGQGEALFGPDVSFAVGPFTQTMIDLLESEVVVQQVIDELGLDTTPEALLSRLHTSTKPDASVLNVTYQDTSPESAEDVLDRVATVFTGLVDDRLGGEQPVAGSDRAPPVTATVFDPAHALTGQVSPRPLRTFVIAGILGVLLGLVLALVRDALANQIRSQAEAQQAFGATVVGVLPKGAVGVSPARIENLPKRVSARLADAFKIVAATLRYSDTPSSASSVVVVTSAQPQEGKTTLTTNLASQLAASGSRVVVVEGDLRRPAAHAFLGGAADQPGLAEVVRGDLTLAEVLTPVGPERSALRMLPAGQRRDGAEDLLTVGRLAPILAELRDVADYVIVDSAPVMLTPDAYPMVQLADRVIVVARENATRRSDAQALAQLMRSLRVPEFSVVLTEASEADRRAYGTYR